jgi:hypothetical protein
MPLNHPAGISFVVGPGLWHIVWFFSLVFDLLSGVRLLIALLYQLLFFFMYDPF